MVTKFPKILGRIIFSTALCSYLALDLLLLYANQYKLSVFFCFRGVNVMNGDIPPRLKKYPPKE
jgi:hypothetical protein